MIPRLNQKVAPMVSAFVFTSAIWARYKLLSHLL